MPSSSESSSSTETTAAISSTLAVVRMRPSTPAAGSPPSVRSSTPTGSPSSARSSTPTAAASSSTPTSAARSASASSSSSSASSFGSPASPTSVLLSRVLVSSLEQVEKAMADLAAVGGVNFEVRSLNRLDEAGRILSALREAEDINWRIKQGMLGLERARTLAVVLRGVSLGLEDTAWKKIPFPATAADVSAVDDTELEGICDDLEEAYAAADGTSLAQEVLRLLTQARDVAAEGRAILNPDAVAAAAVDDDQQLQLDDDDAEPSLVAKIVALLGNIADLMEEVDRVLDSEIIFQT